MGIEELINMEADKLIEKYKAKFKSEGSPMTEREELFFRNGLANGIILSGLAMTNMDCSNILNPKTPTNLN